MQERGTAKTAKENVWRIHAVLELISMQQR